MQIALEHLQLINKYFCAMVKKLNLNLNNNLFLNNKDKTIETKKLCTPNNVNNKNKVNQHQVLTKRS